MMNGRRKPDCALSTRMASPGCRDDDVERRASQGHRTRLTDGTAHWTLGPVGERPWRSPVSREGNVDQLRRTYAAHLCTAAKPRTHTRGCPHTTRLHHLSWVDQQKLAPPSARLQHGRFVSTQRRTQAGLLTMSLEDRRSTERRPGRQVEGGRDPSTPLATKPAC